MMITNKTPIFFIYISCEISPKESFTTGINKHAPCWFFIFLKLSFDEFKNKEIFVTILIAALRFVTYRKIILKNS